MGSLPSLVATVYLLRRFLLVAEHNEAREVILATLKIVGAAKHESAAIFGLTTRPRLLHVHKRARILHFFTSFMFRVC